MAAFVNIEGAANLSAWRKNIVYRIATSYNDRCPFQDTKKATEDMKRPEVWHLNGLQGVHTYRVLWHLRLGFHGFVPPQRPSTHTRARARMHTSLHLSSSISKKFHRKGKKKFSTVSGELDACGKVWGRPFEGMPGAGLLLIWPFQTLGFAANTVVPKPRLWESFEDLELWKRVKKNGWCDMSPPHSSTPRTSTLWNADAFGASGWTRRFRILLG